MRCAYCALRVRGADSVVAAIEMPAQIIDRGEAHDAVGHLRLERAVGEQRIGHLADHPRFEDRQRPRLRAWLGPILGAWLGARLRPVLGARLGRGFGVRFEPRFGARLVTWLRPRLRTRL